MMIMMVIPPGRLLNLIGLEGRASGFSATRSERLLSQLSALTQTERVRVLCVYVEFSSRFIHHSCEAGGAAPGHRES